MNGRQHYGVGCFVADARRNLDDDRDHYRSLVRTDRLFALAGHW